MRLRHAKLIAALVVLANLILLYYSWKSMLWKNLTGDDPSSPQQSGGQLDDPLNQSRQQQQQQAGGNPGIKSPKDKIKNANKHIRKSMTVIFRNIYNYENDLKASIDSILEVIPNMQILVVQEAQPYPPLIYENNNTATGEESTVRFLNLAFDINKSPNELNPLLAIHTKYALFMPDSVRLSNKNLLQKILKEINGKDDKRKVAAATNERRVVRSVVAPVAPLVPAAPTNEEDTVVRRMVIAPFAGNIRTFSSCTQIQLDLPNWTIQYVAVNVSEKCDLVSVQVINFISQYTIPFHVYAFFVVCQIPFITLSFELLNLMRSLERIFNFNEKLSFQMFMRSLRNKSHLGHD